MHMKRSVTVFQHVVERPHCRVAPSLTSRPWSTFRSASTWRRCQSLRRPRCAEIEIAKLVFFGGLKADSHLRLIYVDNLGLEFQQRVTIVHEPKDQFEAGPKWLAPLATIAAPIELTWSTMVFQAVSSAMVTLSFTLNRYLRTL